MLGLWIVVLVYVLWVWWISDDLDRLSKKLKNTERELYILNLRLSYLEEGIEQKELKATLEANKGAS